ncbi:YebC/PmpR family DNA-binding transcriptional regulator [Candidatus Pelagibacter sp.]|nr:YebC/PmpR family DNA-binding transcriptional regulator [Candidatus Pelagibacter sp.]
MAGHSHWAGIKHKKGKVDKQRSKIFSKLSREITVAAKLGEKNPDMNARLRSAVQAARSANMPKDNIERAIEKSSNGDQSNFENIRYEGFGPNKSAVIVEALTDNKNRTASNIRTIFSKNGGSLGTHGSASHNFQRLGVIKIARSEIEQDKIFEIAIDAGARDCISYDDFYEVHTDIEEIYEVKKIFEKTILNFLSTEIEWLPINKLLLEGENCQKMLKFIEALEDEDDVQNIFTNVKFEN